MVYDGEFTYREMIIILAQKCIEEELIDFEDIKKMINSKRNYHRVKRSLTNPKIFIQCSGREVYLGDNC